MAPQAAGPWTHRVLVWTFTLALGLLIYWLLGFVVDDIGNISGPDFNDLVEQRVGSELSEQVEELDRQIARTKQSIDEARQRQKILRDSTANSQTTMNQLLELQRIKLEKGVATTDEESTAFVESQSLFLENQRRYQELNDEVFALNEQLRKLESQRADVNDTLSKAMEPVRDEHLQLWEAHRWRIAAYKLTFLAPLLLIAVFLYTRYRSGPFWALVYAFGIAIVLKVGAVMHETFPRVYFKYILIGVSLLVVVRILVHLLRMVAFPKEDWLIKQYREAYEAFLCPVCDHPIRRGPLKFMAWTRRSIRRIRVPIPTDGTANEPYTCPACATRLYEECVTCGNTRHALLPACESCGTRKSIDS